jgi:hypothetical protein
VPPQPPLDFVGALPDLVYALDAATQALRCHRQARLSQ